MESRTGDRTLMRAALGGDRSAYAQIFMRHAERLGRFAYMILHDRTAAEDAVQETFTRGLTRIRTWRGESDPGAWLYAIALNVCRRAHRDGRVHTEAVARSTDSLRPKRGVVTSIVRRETARQLAVALGFLTEGQREVFVLHYVEDLPYGKVAEILGLTEEAARQLAHRARGVMQKRLPAAMWKPRSS